MKDFENDLIYYPNPDPVKEPRFILNSVDELEKSTKYSVTCNGTERVVYHTDSFDYVVVVDNEAYDLEISIHTPYEKLEIRPSSFGIVSSVKGETVHIPVSYTHLDAERVNQDDEYAAHIMAYAEKAGVEISALAYYPNVMTADKEKRNAAIEHLKNVIRASKKLGVGMVTTFIGRDQTKNVRENLELVKEIWPPIIKLAEVCDVKIAIENCPMLFGEEQWPDVYKRQV